VTQGVYSHRKILIFRSEIVDGSVIALPNEEALVARAKTEPVAFAAIYDHYYPRIYSYVRYHIENQITAEDITAQIFEKALTRLNQYSPKRGSLANWLFGIARHAIRDHLRAKKRRRWCSLDGFASWRSPDPLPEQLVIQNDLHTQVMTAVAGLDDREKDLIALRFGARLTNRRIAALTGLSESNVGVILYRTVHKLRQKLGEME
jgi:RNA polymerase sigma-70 factor (ECF subfamily)